MPLIQLLSMTLVGCTAAPPPPPVPAPAEKGPAVPKATLHHGTITRGTALSFVPCGAQASRPLTAPAAVVEAFPSGATEVVAVFEGIDSPTGVQLTRWHSLGVDANCDGKPFAGDWTAHGTEPFWALSSAGGKAEWSEMGGDPAVWTVQPAVEEAGVIRHTLERPGATGSITFTPAICGDGMADVHYAFQTEVVWGGQTYRGCGMRLR